MHACIAGRPSWNEVCGRLKAIRSRWYNFGINLGVPKDVLDGYKGNDNSLSDVIGYWHDGNVGPVTWDSIVVALKLTEAKRLAKEIEAEYCRMKPGSYYRHSSQ